MVLSSSDYPSVILRHLCILTSNMEEKGLNALSYITIPRIIFFDYSRDR